MAIQGKKHTDTKWTWFQPTIPCKDNCMKHYACYLWETGSSVRVRHFLFFKWLEFKKDWYEL